MPGTGKSNFCAPRAGHEKGGVEHSVGYLRRNYLTPLLEVRSYQELNKRLLESCLQDDERRVTGQPTTIKAAWQVEQPLLRPLPKTPFDYSRQVTVTLNPYSQVVIDTNRYSVPVDKAAKKLAVKVYPFRLEIYRPGEKEPLAVHPRSYARHSDVFDPVHYLPLLEKRPGALRYAKPIRTWRKTWPAVYEKLLARLQSKLPDGRGVREFIRILRLHENHPAPLIEQAVAQSLALNCAHADGVTLCLHRLERPQPTPSPLNLSDRPKLTAVGSQPVNLTQYDQLLSGGGR